MGFYFNRTVKNLSKQAEKVLDFYNAHKDDWIKINGDHFEENGEGKLLSEFNKVRESIRKTGRVKDYIVPVYALSLAAIKIVETKINPKYQNLTNSQIMCACAMSGGNIAELATGEGKTLASVLTAVLSSLYGKGVHIISSNSALAKRDYEHLKDIYGLLGISSGLIGNGLSIDEKKAAYSADITYGTVDEFAFDYLKDNLVYDENDKVQRDYGVVIVDEADNVLLDIASTPLIIGQNKTNNSVKLEQVVMFQKAQMFVDSLTKNDIEMNPEKNEIYLVESEEIIEKMAKMFDLDIEDFGTNSDFERAETGDKKRMERLADVRVLINNALRANYFMRNGKDYTVHIEGKTKVVKLIDRELGRVAEGRGYSHGLQQAIEAKEKARFSDENSTVARTTIPFYFAKYDKICGMTGTAKTSSEELVNYYGVNVVPIPSNSENARIDNGPVWFEDEDSKIQTMVCDIVTESISKANFVQDGRPIVVIAQNINEVNKIVAEIERFNSRLPIEKQLKFQTLTADNTASETEVISKAGNLGMVTIATDMIGRGTDIKLGTTKQEREKILSLGGLKLMISGLHENKRGDNQSLGRAGRQGDVGSTSFYISPEDPIFQINDGYDRVRLRKLLRIVSDRVDRNVEKTFNEIYAQILKNGSYDISAQNYNIYSQKLLPRATRSFLINNIINSNPAIKDRLNKIISSKQKKVEGNDMYARESSMKFDEILYYATNAFYSCRQQILDAGSVVEILNLSMGSKERLTGRRNAERLKKRIEYGKILDSALENITDKEEQELFEFVKMRALQIMDDKWSILLENFEFLPNLYNIDAYAGDQNPMIKTKMRFREWYDEMFDKIREDISEDVKKLAEQRIGNNKNNQK